MMREQRGDPRCDAAKGGSKTQGSALDDPGVPGKKVPAFLYMIPLERWNVERNFSLRALLSMERVFDILSTSYSPDGTVC